MGTLSLKDLSMRFDLPNGEAVQALEKISLTLEAGELLSVLGPSGCGKTTLLNIVAGFLAPTDGQLVLNDHNIIGPDAERGMVFQQGALFEWMSVRENVGFGLLMKRTPEAEKNKVVNHLLDVVGLRDFKEKAVYELSGGMQQRVALARCLANDPDVILMDEPLSNLDALLRMEMRAELKSVLAESDTTTIYVTHDQVEAMSMADRIAIMQGGRIVQAASPVEVYRNPAAHFVGSFIGNPPMNFLTAKNAGEGRWTVGGTTIDGPASQQATLQFAIRPEDLHLGDGGFKATVVVIEPLGPHTLVACKVDDQMFRVILESDTRVAPNDVIGIVPQTDRIRWFDPETELAVPGRQAA